MVYYLIPLLFYSQTRFPYLFKRNLIIGVRFLAFSGVNGEFLEMYEDGSCQFDVSERIQVAFVADITKTNFPNVYRSFAIASMDIVNAVRAVYKDTEFAITTHANYDKSAWRHDQKEACYVRNLNFTTNVSAIEEVAKGLRGLFGGPYEEENALPAAAFAISDNKIGWIRENIDKEGRNVHRMIVLFTDEYTKFDELRDPGNRTRFRGDGTDTCSGSRPATRQQVGEILKKHGVLMIGLYMTYKDSTTVQQYVEFFEEFGIPHLYRNFQSGFDRPVEYEIANYLADVVKRHLYCVYEDPPAYNTLGL